MVKIVWVTVITVGLVLAVGASESSAQFGGRGGLGGIFGGTPQGGRGDRGENTQTRESRVDRPVPDSYQQTEHNLMLMEVDLYLTPQQQRPWQLFTQKALAYASDLSHERALIGVPISEGTAINALQYIDQATDGARSRLAELEDIRDAANALYATLSPDQKNIADTRIAAIIAPRAGVSNGGDGGSASGSGGSGSRAQH